MQNAVGPVLNVCGEVEAVIGAILDDNPDAGVEVIDRGGYLRVQAPNSLRLTRESLQRHIGPDFEIRSLELMISAFAGRIKQSPEEIIWHWAMGPGEVETR